MDVSTRERARRAALTLTCAVGVFVIATHGQETLPRISGRALIQEVGLPAIDRGLRDQDPPREPRGRPGSSAAADARVRLSPTASHVPGSVIVKFKDEGNTGAITAAMQDVQAVSRERPSYATFDVLDIPDGADVEAIAEKLRGRPDVEYAQPRYVSHAMFRPNDTHFGLQWNMQDLGMERAWDVQLGASSSIIVAVLDSGVAFRSALIRYTAGAFRLTPGGPLFPALGAIDVPFAAAPDLGDASRFVAPFDFIWNDNMPLDLDGHGTHVAGTIGQLTNNGQGVAGMAFNARLMPVKVIQDVWDDVFGSPFFGTDDTIARGVRYAVDNGARVINMSIGREQGGPAPAIEDAIRYAVSRGAFVAVASGNTRDSGNQPNRIAEAAPNIQGMVAVGAVARGSTTLAYYSTTNAYVELAAPGGDFRRDGNPGGILQQTLDLDLLLTFETTNPANLQRPRADAFDYYYFQGTSMATPHVSGLAALLMQQGITSPAAIEAAMEQFATDRGAAGKDNEFGYGVINPRSTLVGLGLAR
jgi:serine protease